MEYFDYELAMLLEQDVPFLDNTTFGLGLDGVICAQFYPKKESIVLCGIDECIRLAKMQNLEILKSVKDSTKLKKDEVALELKGDIRAIFKVSKTIQNLLEYASSVATYTDKMLQTARAINPNFSLLGTRKTMPFAKKILLKGLITGGGIPHRYGLSDSILVFKEHRDFCKNFKENFKSLKSAFKEHKIIVEIENESEAKEFAKMGADILQCERFLPEKLESLIKELRQDYPHLLFSATGGVHLENIEKYAKAGADMAVSTSMYRAPICDIKIAYLQG